MGGRPGIGGACTLGRVEVAPSSWGRGRLVSCWGRGRRADIPLLPSSRPVGRGKSGRKYAPL
jgi:hypothetical protein